MTIRIGTSGWVYNHWRGAFYPPGMSQAAWFAHYARVFGTVEINNSFYRLPSETTFDAWREQAPPGFLYAVKASRFLTHMKKLKDPEEPLRTFFRHAGRLGGRLGPVLYQLPPHWQVDLPRFEHFLSILPGDRTHVIEFRDPSWLVEAVFRLMERHHVAHCIHDLPPLAIPLRITASPVYLRLHGEASHSGDYAKGTLETWARRIAAWHDQGLDVFVYFNNDVGGHAPRNAAALNELVRPEAPPRPDG